MSLKFDNHVDICGTYENIIYDIKENTMIKWIQKNTSISEELIIQTMEICIDSRSD